MSLVCFIDEIWITYQIKRHKDLISFAWNNIQLSFFILYMDIAHLGSCLFHLNEFLASLHQKN